MHDRSRSESSRPPIRRPVRRGTSQWLLVDAAIWAVMIIVALWMRFDFSENQLTHSLATNTSLDNLASASKFAWTNVVV